MAKELREDILPIGIKGWYITIPDKQGRDAVRDRFAYSEDQRDKIYLSAKKATKYPHAVVIHKAWICQSGGSLLWEVR